MAGNVEEMLCGFSSSQESLDVDIWDDEHLEEIFDDDMLYDRPASDPMIENLRRSSPQPLTQPSDDLNLFNVEGPAQPVAEIDYEARSLEKHTPMSRNRDWVIARIEEMLERIVDGLLEETGQLTITLKSRSNASRRTELTQALERPPSPKSKDITFPGSSVQEAWRFTAVLRVLELVHSCLVDNTVVTKRDMYYRHPDLFVKQSVVDRYVDDLACTLGVPRASLNVTAAAKGLVAGNFTIRKANGTVIDGLSDNAGCLVPTVSDGDTLDLSDVCRIVVIEKEATFRALLQSPNWKLRGSRCLLVTAKGYPDIATRHFLRYVADHSPQIPILALMDFDPDGIAIMSTYKYGSYRLAHENSSASGAPALNLPELVWLGVQDHQIIRCLVTRGGPYNNAVADAQGLMRLTSRDRRKGHRMLEWDLCAEDGPEPTWRQSLQTMLMLNIKAEMQFFEQLHGGLGSWMEEALSAKERMRTA